MVRLIMMGVDALQYLWKKYIQVPGSLGCGMQKKWEEGMNRFQRKIERETPYRERGGEGWSGRERKGEG